MTLTSVQRIIIRLLYEFTTELARRALTFELREAISLHIYLVKEVITLRNKITLACTECKQRNYNTTKNKKNNPDRIELRKFCKFCGKETLHKETK